MAWCIFALFTRQTFKIALLSTFICDISLQLFLAYWANSKYDTTIVSFDFYHRAFDIFVLAFIRMTIFFVLSNMAVKWWNGIMSKAKQAIVEEANIDMGCPPCPSDTNMISSPIVVDTNDSNSITNSVNPSPNLNTKNGSSNLSKSPDDGFELGNVVDAKDKVILQGRKMEDTKKKPLLDDDAATTIVTGVPISTNPTTRSHTTSHNSTNGTIDPTTASTTNGTELVTGRTGTTNRSTTGIATDDLGDQYSSTKNMKSKTNYISDVQKADFRKYCIIYTIFALTFVNSIYVGVKTVAFSVPDNNNSWEQLVMGLGVILINLEFFLLRDYIEDLTTEDGELIKSLHIHPLYFAIDLKCHVCDICHEKTRKPYFEAYRCRTCDFDLCTRCYRRKDSPDFKGVGFRGGAVTDVSNNTEGGESLTTYSYFMKCVQMCLEFYPTLILAMGSLVICQVLTPLAPNLQGQIFDAIIGKDHNSIVQLNRTGNINSPDATSVDTTGISLHFDLDHMKQILDPIGLLGLDQLIHSEVVGIHPNVDRFRHVMRMYILVNVLSGLFNGMRSLGINLSMRNLAATVRRKLFAKIVLIDISYFDSMHTGQLTSRLTNDASAMVSPMDTILNDLVSNAILLVGGIFMAFLTSWKLSILSICVVPPITFIYRRYAHWARKINRAIWQSYGECNSVATECISNIRTVRAFAAESYEVEKFDNGIGVALSHGIRSSFVGASVQMFSSYMNLLTAVLILWYGGNSVIQGENGMTIGSLISFQLYWNMMNSSFLSLGNVFNQLIQASAAAERVFQIIEGSNSSMEKYVKSETNSSTSQYGSSYGTSYGSSSSLDQEMQLVNNNNSFNNSFSAANIRGELKLDEVYFRYKTRPDNAVLNGINLTMKPGTTTALVGKSGGGKSTIIHLLLRFYEPTSGKIMLDGKYDLHNVDPREIRQLVGFVAQDTQLFATTILENLLYGLPNRDNIPTSRVINACKLANAHEFICEMEEKYETRVGEKGIMLSGGQKQRIALARCFLRQPKFLFLDEATSALDAENESLVQQGIDELLKKTDATVLLIAHRLSTVLNSDQIAVISKGVIVELGNHQELCKMQEGIYKRLVEKQMEREKNTIVEEKEEKTTTKKKSSDKNNGTEIDKLFDQL